MIKTYIVFLLIFTLHSHVSFLSVECFPKRGIVEGYVKMNYNDFIFDYRAVIDDDQSFDPSGKIDTTKILVRKYLNSRIHIYAGDRKLNGELNNIEMADNELKIYFHCHYQERTRLFKVKNMILTDLYENQSNLLIFKCDELEEGITLTREMTEHSFKVK